ncbi:MAG: isoamylase early set domain-containing protein [Opitutaceae bacterium]|nr:isoamylase early set domain-containing protein [Opitutaceae bacterium]
MKHATAKSSRGPARRESRVEAPAAVGDVTATLLWRALELDPLTLHPATRTVLFGLEAPAARRVSLAGTFNDWNVEAHPLAHQADGVWLAELELPPGRYEYRYFVDGQWCDDPQAVELVPNPFGSFNAVLTV